MTNPAPVAPDNGPVAVPNATRRGYLRDPERIELALPPRLLWHLCVILAKDPNTDPEWMDPILADFAAAVDAAFAGMPRVRADKMIRGRLDNARKVVMGEFESREGQTIVTPLYVVHLLIQDLLNTSAWTYKDGGPFDRAYRSLMKHLFAVDEPACARNRDSIDGAEDSARKNTRKARERLSAAGYYRDLLTPASLGAAA